MIAEISEKLSHLNGAAKTTLFELITQAYRFFRK